MTLDEMIGHHLMIGIPGRRVSSDVVRQFKETYAAGLILFRPNFASAEKFRQLLVDLDTKVGRHLLAAVDHEGGRVIHLAEGVTVFPDNWMIGNTKKAAYARKQGAIEAAELRRLGVDLNLAPTLDVLTENYSPNIGIRSYGKKAVRVSRFGAQRIKAMQKAGLSACAKHFPGLGAATLDPHLDLPTLSMSFQELREIHLKPFLAAIKAGVDCVMSSHPVYPKLDASKVPATFSRKLIHGLLRKELGFKGVILSDDLEMGALRGICSIGEAAVRAVHSGHDMVLVCHDLQAQREVFQSLRQAYRSGRLQLKNLHQSVERVQTLIRKRKRRFTSGALKPEAEGLALTRKIAKEGLESSHLNEMKWAAKQITLLFPDFSELAGKFFIEPELLKPQAFLTKAFFGKPPRVNQVLLLPLLPKDQDFDKVRSLTADSGVVYFCWDAHLSQAARDFLEYLKKRSHSAVVLLRDPYDLKFVDGKLPVVTAFGFRKVQIEAAVKALIGK